MTCHGKNFAMDTICPCLGSIFNWSAERRPAQSKGNTGERKAMTPEDSQEHKAVAYFRAFTTPS